MASTSGLQHLATSNLNNLPKLHLNQSQLWLPGPVALGLGVHGAAKPLCQLSKALQDQANTGSEKPLVVKQQSWDVTLIFNIPFTIVQTVIGN